MRYNWGHIRVARIVHHVKRHASLLIWFRRKYANAVITYLGFPLAVNYVFKARVATMPIKSGAGSATKQLRLQAVFSGQRLSDKGISGFLEMLDRVNVGGLCQRWLTLGDARHWLVSSFRGVAL